MRTRVSKFSEGDRRKLVTKFTEQMETIHRKYVGPPVSDVHRRNLFAEATKAVDQMDDEALEKIQKEGGKEAPGPEPMTPEEKADVARRYHAMIDRMHAPKLPPVDEFVEMVSKARDESVRQMAEAVTQWQKQRPQ